MHSYFSLISVRLAAWLVISVLLAGGLSAQLVKAATFAAVIVDASMAGDCKAVGDVDGDGFPDLVVGGMPNEKLNWYRYPAWGKTVIATPATEFTTDCAMGDVDGDGDLDIVVPDGNAGNNLLWFQNPRPAGNPSVGGQWTQHAIGSINDFGKDVKLADFDGDGRLDVATRNYGNAMIFFQNSAQPWSRIVLNAANIGSEGMGMGDVDKDGRMDLVVRGAWLKNPGGNAARTAGAWTEYSIGSVDAAFKALVADINGDGKPEILFTSSENTADLAWFSYGAGGPTGSWTGHTIVADLEKAHTLQAADMDNDGDLDIITGQMHTSQDKEVAVWFNGDGQGNSWYKQLLDTGGLHNGQVADIGNDGRFDVFGANWTGNPPLRLWRNLPPAAPVTTVYLPFLLLLLH